ncbi:MAG: hypothetical protein Q7T16_00320, partial [Candidatus Burarchaeum sp.]
MAKQKEGMPSERGYRVYWHAVQKPLVSIIFLILIFITLINLRHFHITSSWFPMFLLWGLTVVSLYAGWSSVKNYNLGISGSLILGFVLLVLN